MITVRFVCLDGRLQPPNADESLAARSSYLQTFGLLSLLLG